MYLEIWALYWYCQISGQYFCRISGQYFRRIFGQINKLLSAKIKKIYLVWNNEHLEFGIVWNLKDIYIVIFPTYLYIIHIDISWADPVGHAFRLNLLWSAHIFDGRVIFSFRLDLFMYCRWVNVRESVQKEKVWQQITTATVLFLLRTAPTCDEYPLRSSDTAQT